MSIGNISEGTLVEIKPGTADYYPGSPAIPSWVITDYNHRVTQVTSGGKPVIKGGKTCVLLGKKVNRKTGVEEAGINTWVDTDALSVAGAASGKNDSLPLSGVSGSGGVYTVKSGDTLWGIAAATLGNGNRYPEIKTLNNLTSDNINIGQVLKIPASSAPATQLNINSQPPAQPATISQPQENKTKVDSNTPPSTVRSNITPVSGGSGTTPAGRSGSQPATGSISSPAPSGRSGSPPAAGRSSTPLPTDKSGSPPSTGSDSKPPLTGSDSKPTVTGRSNTPSSRSGSSSVPNKSDSPPASAGTDSYETYIVKKGDTLQSITAEKLGNGNRKSEIKKLNGIVLEFLKVGQELKIPRK